MKILSVEKLYAKTFKKNPPIFDDKRLSNFYESLINYMKLVKNKKEISGKNENNLKPDLRDFLKNSIFPDPYKT